MRSLLVFATLTAALLPASTTLADDYEDCKVKCAADRDTRNANCPSPYDSSERERAQCLNDSREIYLACVHACPPPASSQSGPSTMTYEAGQAGAAKAGAQDQKSRRHIPRPATS